MKASKFTLLLVFFFASACCATAQMHKIPLNEPNYNKRKIFADLPERLLLRLKNAEQLLELPVGATVNATLATGLPLTGTVVSKSNPADTSVKSVVIRTDRQNATFAFSRIRNIDGSLSFTGRMLNMSGGDALEIAKEGAEYIIRKRSIHEMFNE